MVLLTPALLVSSTPIAKSNDLAINDWDSTVGVVDGDTFFYTIDEFTLPASVTPTDVTLPDFTGNQIVLKVMYVDNNYEFNSTVTGPKIYFTVGFLFTKDTVFGLDISELVASEIVIPAGAATPSISIAGRPHFADGPEGPLVWVLNNDWAEHEAFLSNIGFVVTNAADTFTATLTNGTGTFSVEYRKSDGVLTHALIDEIIFMGLDTTGYTFEISLDKKESRPLNVNVGDQVMINADILTAEVTGSGDLYNNINQSDVTSVQNTLASIEGDTVLRFVVNDVYGCFYVASIYGYNMESATLENIGEIYFNGFFGAIQNVEPPHYDDHPTANYNPSGIGPYLTPDWDIYEGYMILGDTILGVYINELLNAISAPETDQMSFNTLDFNFGFDKKTSYYYFQESAEVDIDVNMTDTSSIIPLAALGIYETGIQVTASEQMYLAYHQSGVLASIHMKADVTVAIYSDIPISGAETGTVTISIEIKLVNPVYNAPDNFGGGFIPGFEWLVAIPALMGVAIVSIISRKKK